MSSEIVLEGVTYLPSRDAALQSGYAQDYIGQLSRKGLVDARRIGGLWYVSIDSLNQYKENKEQQKVDPPRGTISQDPDTLVLLDGKEFASSSRIAKLTGYSQDYVGQLARSGKILSKQVGNRWYVERAGILDHKKEKDALLAAVQSGSVGFSHPAEKGEMALTPQEHAISQTHFTYTAGERIDSIPAMTLRNEIHDLSKKSAQDVHAIPIQVVHREKSHDISDFEQVRRVDPNLRRNQTSEKRISLSAVFMVVGVILVGTYLGFYPYFDRLNPYAFDIEVVHSQSNAVSLADYSGSSIGGRFWTTTDRIGAILENILVSEMTYTRIP